MIPIAKNILVVDEQGNEYGATWPKRARGLVKNGRARFLSENKICLACPPWIDMEDNEMTDVIMTDIQVAEGAIEAFRTAAVAGYEADRETETGKNGGENSYIPETHEAESRGNGLTDGSVTEDSEMKGLRSNTPVDSEMKGLRSNTPVDSGTKGLHSSTLESGKAENLRVSISDNAKAEIPQDTATGNGNAAFDTDMAGIPRAAENRTAPAGGIDMNYIFDQIRTIQNQTDYLLAAIDGLAGMSDGESGDMYAPGNIMGQAKATAFGDMVRCRETTNQQLLNFYMSVYNDLKSQA